VDGDKPKVCKRGLYNAKVTFDVVDCRGKESAENLRVK